MNFVIKNKHWEEWIQNTLFPGEKVIELPENADMFDILVKTGMFPSKGQARKNWKLTGQEIPKGFNGFTDLGKKRTRIWIWNPVE